MSDNIGIPSDAIRIGIIGTIMMLLIIAWNRVKGILISDWDHELKVSRLRKRPILMTVMKMYSNVQSSPPEQLSEDVRNELLINLALAYDKPTAYFVRMRDNPEQLRRYLKNEELVEFFFRPQYWANKHLMEETSSLSKIFQIFRKKSAGDEFLHHLERIVENFEKVLMSVRTQEQADQAYPYNRYTEPSQA